MSRKVVQSAVVISCAGLVLSISVGCAGKKLSTSASDQTMIAGEKPQVEAQVASPPSAEASAPTITPQTEAATARAETMPEAPVPQPEPPRAEVSAEAPKMEEAKTEIPPSSVSSEPPPVEEKPSALPLPSAAESAPSVVAPPSAPAVAEATQPAGAPPSIPATSEETAALSDVFFDFDRFAIRQDAQATLEANARWLKTANGRKVLIEGHCDERGTVEYNLVLGEKRAQSVKQYLEELGVPASQIQITSFGKEKPFCTEHSDACWQQNRRAHFVLQ